MEKHMISVGQVVGLHGKAGEIKVKVLTDFPDRFARNNRIELCREDGETQMVTIEGTRPHKNHILIRLKDIGTREDAECLRGAFFRIEESQLMPLPAHSYYRFQIIGLKVFTLEGELLGEVSDILTTPNHDVYVVKGEKEYLIPARKVVVKKVELEQGKMWIDREMIEYFED